MSIAQHKEPVQKNGRFRGLATVWRLKVILSVTGDQTLTQSLPPFYAVFEMNG